GRYLGIKKRPERRLFYSMINTDTFSSRRLPMDNANPHSDDKMFSGPSLPGLDDACAYAPHRSGNLAPQPSGGNFAASVATRSQYVTSFSDSESNPFVTSRSF